MPNRIQIPGKNTPLSPLPDQIHGKAAAMLGVNNRKFPAVSHQRSNAAFGIDMLGSRPQSRAASHNTVSIEHRSNRPENRLTSWNHLAPESLNRQSSIRRSASLIRKRLSISSSAEDKRRSVASSIGDESCKDRNNVRKRHSLSMHQLRNLFVKPKAASIIGVSEMDGMRRNGNYEYHDTNRVAHRQRQSRVSFILPGEIQPR
jgi:DNA-binding PucR family transcriptional regulator